VVNRRTPPSGRTPSPATAAPALSVDEAEGVAEAALRAAFENLSIEPEPPQVQAAEAEVAAALEESPPGRVEDVIAIAMAAWRASGVPVPAHAEAALAAALTGKVQTDDAGAMLTAAEIQARHELVQQDLDSTSDYSDRKRANMKDKLRHEPLVSYVNPVKRTFSINNVFIEADAGPIEVPATVLEHLLQFNAYEGYAETYKNALRLSGEDAGFHEIRRQNVAHDLLHGLPAIPDLRGLGANGPQRAGFRIR